MSVDYVEVDRDPSGRISEIGTLVEVGIRLIIEAPKTTAGLSVGGSVNVNGTCLSAVDVDEGSWLVHGGCGGASARSTLGQIPAGARVNLELPLRVGDRLDGHLVQGHTDAIGKVTRVDKERGRSAHRVSCTTPSGSSMR